MKEDIDMFKKSKKRARLATSAVSIFSILTLMLSGFCSSNLPDSFSVFHGERLQINNAYKISERGNFTLEVDNSLNGSNYKAEVRLFGIIPLKSINVQVVEKKYVVPCGTLFGLKIFTDGVLVVGMTDVATKNGLVNPAEKAGIKIGDVIVSMNGSLVNSSEDVADIVEKSKGSKISAEIRRKNMSFTVELTPAILESDGTPKIGLWVRDSSAGIGTLTFYDPESGIAAGLGHAICDVDTGEALPIMSGEIVEADIIGITKGQNGTPGEIRGRFRDGTSIGKIIQNSETGVYGKLNQKIDIEMVEVALKQHVKKGKAQIISTLDNKTGPQFFDCIIEKVYYNDNSPTQNMVIRITDEALLEKTGGIIQGMSGSPIIQNGKLIGAVTHVFVNDPTCGYGIFAENMLKTTQSVAQEQIKEAS